MFDVFHLSYFIKSIKSNTNNVLSLSFSLTFTVYYSYFSLSHATFLFSSLSFLYRQKL